MLVEIDGASPIRMFLRVTLPLIRPALLVAIIFLVLIIYILATDTAPDDGFAYPYYRAFYGSVKSAGRRYWLWP